MSRKTAFNVTFIGDWATITTTVEAPTEDKAILLAGNLLADNYSFDLDSWQTEAGRV